MTNYSSKLETITPDIAAEYLLTMGRNRSLRAAAVAAFAQQIRSGEFSLIPEGIAFDASGALRDGQHRLAAIIMSGTPVRMNVHRGLTEEQIAAIDQGTARTAADVEVMAGDAHGRLHVSIVRQCAVLCGSPAVKMMSSAYRVGLRQVGAEHVREIASIMPGPACVCVVKAVLALARPLDPAAVDLLAHCAYAGRGTLDAGAHENVFGEHQDKKQAARNQTLTSLLQHRRGISRSADVLDAGRRWARGVKAWLDGEGLIVLRSEPSSFDWLMAERKKVGLADQITCTEKVDEKKAAE